MDPCICQVSGHNANIMKTKALFKPYQPNQLLLLPPDMRQWLPQDDLAYFIMDVVSELDLSAIYRGGIAVVSEGRVGQVGPRFAGRHKG
jgi:hypothetical protein